MKKYRRYKIAIWVLAGLVILQSFIILMIGRPKKIPRVPPAAIKGRIAIVIDDWGYNTNNLEIAGQIKYPLTASVLPNLAYSTVVARNLKQAGFQIILHLPMEPHEKYRLEHNTIMTAMDELTIRDIISQDLLSMLQAEGVSNHMGSRATEDLETMALVFKELKRRRLYFLDSMVSAKSIARGLAARMQVRYARRDVFLDNAEDPQYIKGQIYKLKMKAKTYGQAIGIGHDRKNTLEVLKEMLPRLEKEGYKFVFVSELVR